MRQQEIVLSEATAGRFLRSLDRRGLTRPIGKLGRLLTEEGHSRLKRLQALQRQGEHSALLVEAATPIDVDEFIDLLYVRRAVEPEAARHAALLATDEERVAMRAVADAQIHHVFEGTDHAALAIDFHRLVAEASHNKMLTAVASLTLDPSNDALSTLLDFISVEAGAHFTFAHEPRAVVDAIIARKPQIADAACAYVNDLISVVQGYRQRTPLLNASIPPTESGMEAEREAQLAR